MEYVSINKMALLLDTSVNTIKRWYKWYEDDEYEKPSELLLPNYFYLDGRGTKYFKTTDIEIFKHFQFLINTKYRGIMSKFNAKFQWGTIGKKYLKEEQNEES